MFEGKKQIVWVGIGGAVGAQVANAAAGQGSGFLAVQAKRWRVPVAGILAVLAAVYLSYGKVKPGPMRMFLLGMVAVGAGAWWAGRKTQGVAQIAGMDEEEDADSQEGLGKVIDVGFSEPPQPAAEASGDYMDSMEPAYY